MDFKEVRFDARNWMDLANNRVQWRAYVSAIIMDGSPGDLSEEPLTQENRKEGWRTSCDVREATEGLENEL